MDIVVREMFNELGGKRLCKRFNGDSMKWLFRWAF